MSLITPFLLTLVPSPLTHQLLPYLSAYLPYIFPPSPRGSEGYQRNYRHVFTLVVGAYLVWSFGWGSAGKADNGGSGDPDIGRDWYSLLGVRRGAGEEELKKAFRTLSRTYHPDRAGSGAGDQFIRIRQAYEGLSDPTKRWAYDRFGSDISNWKAITIREYMRFGLNQSSGFYVASGGFMLVLSLLGRAKDGAFWRHLLFALLLMTELRLLLASSPSSTLSQETSSSLLDLPSRLLKPVIGDRPPFIEIRILHRLFASLSIGISQLTGVWSSDGQRGREAELEDILRAVGALEVEAISGFHETVVSLLAQGDPLVVEAQMKRGMEEVMLDRAISTHPQIRPLWVDAVGRAEAKRNPVRSAELYPSIPTGYVAHSKYVDGKRTLGVAAGIPLPPSPPPSPRLGPQRI